MTISATPASALAPHPTHVVVVGGGHAAASLCAQLRQRGFTGRISLVSQEELPPYHRPPLSKKFLGGGMAEQALAIRPSAWYTEQGIDLHLGQTVTALLPGEQNGQAAHNVQLGDGRVLQAPVVVLATGTRARPWPGPEPVGTLRTLQDSRQCRETWQALLQALWPSGRAPRLCMVGGGYIGLEVAATARQLCLNVQVVEQAPRLLARVASPLLAQWVQQWHEAQGVEVCLGASAQESLAQADIALAGIGALANDELARSAGLACEDGIVVDGACRCSVPGIWAIGDVTRFHYRGQALRLESVQNANDQASVCARSILGEVVQYRPVPWFWSDQYQHKLQMVGWVTPADGQTQDVARVSNEHQRSVWRFGQDGRLLAVEAANDAPAYAIAKRWLEAAALRGESSVSGLDPAQVADPACELKSLMPLNGPAPSNTL